MVPGRREKSEAKPVVLIVEDNADTMMWLSALLKPFYSILEARDGEAGLNTALTRLPDLILLDISLPKKDGYAVAAKIKASPAAATIPVIAFTAHAMKGDRKKALAAGCDDYVAKPVDPDDLLTLVKRWVT